MAEHIWTAEKLAVLELPQLKALRNNADRKGATELAEMCQLELNARAKKTARRQSIGAEAEVGDIVIEFHFVCRNDLGVTFNSDGTFWSASWVVSEDVLRRSMKHNAKLALHNSKAELSYRQGLIKEYRRVDDFKDGEVESRLDFLVVPDAEPLAWAGTGAGEKGYKRAKSTGNVLTDTVSSEET